MDDSKKHLQFIYGLRADILPHRQWVLSKWYHANPYWYYHRRGSHEEITATRNFYKLVDPELRQLCHLLHEHGVRTTPSCQGHFYDKDHFKKTWDELRRDAASINSGGLGVTDSESQQEYLFRYAGYRLPWATFDDFYAQAHTHQRTGFIGLVVPFERESVWMTLQSLRSRDEMKHLGFDPALTKILGAYVFDIFVHADGPEERSTKWRSVTETIRERFAV